MRLLIILFSLVVSYAILANDLPLTAGKYANSSVKIDNESNKIRATWYGMDTRSRAYSISVFCDGVRNPVWTYQFPSNPNIEVDGVALVMFKGVDNFNKVDLEDSETVHAIFDSNYAIQDTLDLTQLFYGTREFDKFDPMYRFAWVGYKSTQDGTKVVVTTPTMTGTEMFLMTAGLADYARDTLKRCDATAEAPVHVRYQIK